MTDATTSKICASCGRSFGWRRKWARTWNEVRYCSRQCRRERRQDREVELETEILSLLRDRPAGRSICPSEVARRIEPANWQHRMESVRRAARRLVARDEIDILQAGRIVEPDRVRGAIRFRLR